MPEIIEKRRMYEDLAWAWPIISPPDDYVEESDFFARLINEQAQIPVKHILNLGCGGGHNDATLKKHFEVTGIDISQDMLNMAKRLNSDVEYVCGDMRAVRIGRQFDAVTVFDAISYMRNEESLRAAFNTAFQHLKPGGVFVTYVEETRDAFKQNQTRCSCHGRDDIEIVLVENYYDPDPADNSYEGNFIYLIRRQGRLTVETDSHLLGLFSLDTWLELMGQVGFVVERVPDEAPDKDLRQIPILLGTKPIN